MFYRTTYKLLAKIKSYEQLISCRCRCCRHRHRRCRCCCHRCDCHRRLCRRRRRCCRCRRCLFSGDDSKDSENFHPSVKNFTTSFFFFVPLQIKDLEPDAAATFKRQDLICIWLK